MPPPDRTHKPAPPSSARIWLGFAGAALACVLIAALHYRYESESAVKHVALFEFQKASGELTQAVLDVAIAEDGGEDAQRRPALKRIIDALDVIEARKVDVAGAQTDTALADALRELRGVATSMRSAASMDPRSHTRLQVAFSSAARLLEGRAAAGRAGMAMLKAEQNRLFSAVVVLSLMFIAFGAMALARMRRLGEAAERRVERVTQLYRAQSHINEAVARAEDFAVLAEEVCRIAVEDGGLECAIVRRHQGTDNTLRVVAFHAPRTGLIGREVVPAGETLGVSAAAFGRQARVIVGDMALDQVTRHAAEQTARLGVRSAAGFPLVSKGGTFGTFAVFGPGTDFFDTEMADLLEECAHALSLAFGQLATRRAVRESEERYRTLFETSPDGIRIICDGQVVMVNPAYQRLFGPVTIGQTIDEAVFQPGEPAARERMAQRLRRVLEDRQAVPPDEQSFALPDGRRVPMEVTSVPFVFDGRPAVLTLLRDLTEQHARQQALEEAERRYRSLVETSLSGIMLLHAGHFDYVNHALVRLLGLERPDELLGRHFSDVTDPQYVPEISANLRTLEEAPGSSFQRGRLRLLRDGGQPIDVEVAAASLLLEGRIMVLTEVRDISGEVAARNALQALNRSLEERIAERTDALSTANRNLQAANHDLESFSYSVAHDLRAPLRNMIGFANLLKIDIDEQNLAAVPLHAERVVASAERMNGLIDGLLAVSRVSHGALADAKVDFATLLVEVLREASPEARVKIEVGTMPVVNCDLSTMRQVWTNLISNAIKYSAKRDDPHIAVACRRTAEELVFDVTDNGAGFEPAYAERLFGVFQRLHSSREFEGNGVGLAIVRRIVERHGGRVWAEGTPGAGAAFHFSLPAVRIIDTRGT